MGLKMAEMRLFVDLDKCSECPECTITCSYFYHEKNLGITNIRELATYAIICRHCEVGSCVRSCPTDALELINEGQQLRRWNLRCISCKSCSTACPFGTILPELLPYLVQRCDYCVDRTDKGVPQCVSSCPREAIRYGEIEENPEENIQFVGENLAVRVTHWVRQVGKDRKKQKKKEGNEGEKGKEGKGEKEEK